MLSTITIMSVMMLCASPDGAADRVVAEAVLRSVDVDVSHQFKLPSRMTPRLSASMLIADWACAAEADLDVAAHDSLCSPRTLRAHDARSNGAIEVERSDDGGPATPAPPQRLAWGPWAIMQIERRASALVITLEQRAVLLGRPR